DDRPENLPRDRTQLKLLALGCLRRAMAQHDVRQLVRHDTGYLSFRPRRFEHPAVDEHRSTGQGERIDLALVDGLERIAESRVPQARRDHRHQTLAETGD